MSSIHNQRSFNLRTANRRHRTVTFDALVTLFNKRIARSAFPIAYKL